MELPWSCDLLDKRAPEVPERFSWWKHQGGPLQFLCPLHFLVFSGCRVGNHVYIHLSYRGTFFEERRSYEGIINHYEIPGIYPGNYHVLIGGECGAITLLPIIQGRHYMGPILGLIKVDANVGNFVWVGNIMTPVVMEMKNGSLPPKVSNIAISQIMIMGERLPSLIGEIK